MCSILFPLTRLFCSWWYAFSSCFRSSVYSFVHITMTWRERAHAGYSLQLNSAFQVLKRKRRVQEICFRWRLSSSGCTIWTVRMNKRRQRCGAMTTQTKRKKNYKLSSVLFYQAKTQSFTQLNKWKTTARIFFTPFPICLEILHVESVFIRVGLEKQNTVSTLESLPLIFTPKSL